MKSMSSRRSRSYIDSLEDWARGEPIRVSRGRQASDPWTRKGGVTMIAWLGVVTRVGASGEDILQAPSGD
jgi:hypothetical protein